MSDSSDEWRLAPWNIMDSEPELAFERFAFYRDLGGSRSLSRVRQKYGYKTVRQLEKWSSKFHWVQRARAYDAYVDGLFLSERIRERENHRQQTLSVVSVLKTYALNKLKEIQTLDLDPKDLVTIVERMDRIESRLLGTHAPIEITTPKGRPVEIQAQTKIVLTPEQVADLGADSIVELFRDMDD